MLSISNTQSGLITSAFGIAYAILQIPGGLLGDRFGGGRTLLFSLSIAAISPIIMIFGNSFSSALISRAISGAACGILVPSCVRLISSWFSRERAQQGNGRVRIGIWYIPGFVAFLILPLILVGPHWQAPLLFVVIYTLAITVLAIFPAKWKSVEATIRQEEAREEKTTGVNFRGLLTGQLFALTLPNFAALAVGVGVITWATPFLASSLGLTDIEAGRLIALIGIASVTSAFLGSYLAGRFGGRRIIIISTVIAFVFPALFGFYSLSFVLASFWLFGIGLSGMLYLATDFALVPYAAIQGPKVPGWSLEFSIHSAT